MRVCAKQMMAVVMAVAMLSSFGGCKGSGGGADSVTWYNIDIPSVKIAPGADAAVLVRFIPREGYHWNPEFPARLKLSDPGSVKTPKADFSLSDGDFKDDSGVGALSIQVAAQAAGQTALKGVADFSICNDKECRIFKKIAVEVPIDVH